MSKLHIYFFPSSSFLSHFLRLSKCISPVLPRSDSLVGFLMMIGSGPAAIWRPSSFQKELLSSFSLQLLQCPYAWIVEHILHYNIAWRKTLFWLVERCSLIFDKRSLKQNVAITRDGNYTFLRGKEKNQMSAMLNLSQCLVFTVPVVAAQLCAAFRSLCLLFLSVYVQIWEDKPHL